MSESLPRLQPDFCRLRQRRLLESMQRLKVDRSIFVSPENVHYLTGLAPHRLLPAVVSLESDGRCVLCTADNTGDEDLAADEVIPLEAQRHATLRQERTTEAVQSLARALRQRQTARLGVEFSRCVASSLGISQRTETIVDLEPEIWRLRRRKDPDEMELIRHAVRCTERMYETARNIIEPGLTELEVYGRLHAAAVNAAGEPLTGFGNDFQCDSIGGPPRRRAAQAGELYILDLGPAYRGYYADTCRTFSVDRQPTDIQYQTWEVLVTALEQVEVAVRPGVSCRALYESIDAMLAEHLPGGLIHHLGHGIGLEPHEAPHLNPFWNDTFEEGDVFTAEPGLYAPNLRAGIRLEQNYRVTSDGVERLTSFPLDL